MGNPITSVSCTPGDPVTGVFLYVTFTVTATQRYDVNIIGDVIIDGVYSYTFEQCLGDYSSGTYTVSLGSLMWTCGSELVVAETVFSWDQQNGGDNPDACKTCPDTSPKCKRFGDIKVNAPLVADCDYTAECLPGDPFQTIHFSADPTGGTPPYTYSWDFGDGIGTSTDASPSYTYQSEGSFTVTLTVTDANLIQDSESKTIMVMSCCSLEVSCPSPSVFDLTCNDDMPDCVVSEQDFLDLLGASISNPCGPVTVTCSDNGAICDGSVERIITISDGTTTVMCTLTYNFSKPALSIQCSNSGTPACQTQANVDVAFSTWLNNIIASAAGGCGNLTVTTVPSSPQAPNACGGQVDVTFEVEDGCGQSSSCVGTFTVVDAPTVILNCPGIANEPACQTQAAIDQAFADWLNDVGWSGGCNATISNNNTGAPSACGGSTTVTWTVASSCQAPVTCSATFTVADAPAVVLTCPLDANETSCQTQAAIDQAFADWLDDVVWSGGCNASISNNNTGAPLACGGSTTVTWTVTSDCADDTTCSATFTVADATAVGTAVVLNCPADANEAACQSQTDIDLAFANWLGQVNWSGGCGASISNDNTGAPSACGGSTTVTWTVASSCQPPVTCSATFTVADAPAVVLTCPPDANETSCQTQAAIDQAFADWLDDVVWSGGCNASISNNNTGAPLACGGSTTVTWTVTSDCADDTTCSATFTVADATAAGTAVVLNCPADANETACQSQTDIDLAFANWLGQVNWSGGCGASISNDNTGAPSACGGSTTVTWTVASSCQAPVTCSATFTVADAPAVVLTCPPDANETSCQTQAAIDQAFADWLDDVVWSGGCNASISNNNTGAPLACGGATTVTWTVASSCQAPVTCSATFTVTDAPAVVLTCPADANEPACQTQVAIDQAFAAWLNDVVWSGGCNASISNNNTGAPLACGGATTVTWTVTSDCEDDVTCSATFTVTDAPTLNIDCPDDANLAACQSQADVDLAFNIWLQSFGYSGGCNVTETDLSGMDAPDACGGSATVTYAVSDDCGQSSVCSRTFTVRDAFPVLLNCPADTIVQEDQTQAVVDQAFEDWKGRFESLGGCNAGTIYKVNDVIVDLNSLAAPDACGGDITVEMVRTSTCGSDSCESQFIVIASVEGLILALPGNQSTCSNAPAAPTWADLPVAKSDQEIISQFLITSACVDPGEIDINHLESPPSFDNHVYTFVRTYYVTAPNNLSTQSDEIFEVLHDPDPPVLSGLPEDLVLPCGSAIPPMPTVTGYDIVFGEVEVVPSISQVPSSCGGYRVTRTWTARDGCGNVAQGVQRIIFEDNEPPVLNVPEDVAIPCGDEIPDPTYSVTDACSDVFVDFDESISGDPDCEHQITRTWTARDGCGNKVTKTQVIDVFDDQAPVITVVKEMLADIPNGGNLIMYGCNDPQVSPDDIAVTDNCCADIAIATGDDQIASSACEIFGYYRRWRCWYTATDGAGNMSEFFFYVIQYDTTAPVLHNVPDDLALDCGQPVPAPSEIVRGQDDCSLVPEPDFEESITYDPSDSTKFVVVRTWSVEDRCGNRTEESQIITVCGFDTAAIAGSLGNTVWNDADQDGLQGTSEEGINGVKVYLYHAEPAGDPIMMDSTTTYRSNGKDGQFSFDYLTADEYQIRFVTPPDWRLTLANQGNNDEIDSDADVQTGMTEVIAVDGNKIVTFDAGMVALSALPVELGTFTAEANQCQSQLRWTTLSEHGTEKFVVQRSSNGVRFENLGEVTALGDPSTGFDYAFLDEQPLERNVYRLLIQDFDGSKTYSVMRALDHKCRSSRLPVAIFPNPSLGQFNLTLDLETDQTVHIQVRDKLGRRIWEGQRTLGAGKHVESLDIGTPPVGLYHILIGMGDVQTHQMIIIGR